MSSEDFDSRLSSFLEKRLFLEACAVLYGLDAASEIASPEKREASRDGLLRAARDYAEFFRR